MDNYCFLDAEVRKSSSDFVDGWGTSVPSFLDPEQELTKSNMFSLGFGVAATYDNRGIRLWTDPGELLLFLLDPTIDAIVGFNVERFDFAVLLAEIDAPTCTDKVWQFSDAFKDTYIQLKAKSIDILVEVERTLGHRISLTQITSALFETAKDIDAKGWWAMYNSVGLHKRTKAINYLLGDLIQAYKIYGVAHELGQLAYRDQLGNTCKFDIKMPRVSDLKNKP